MWPSKGPLLKSACETLVICVIVISQIVTCVPPKSNLPYPHPVALLLAMNGHNVASIHKPPPPPPPLQRQQQQQQLPQQAQTRPGRIKFNSSLSKNKIQSASLVTGGVGERPFERQVIKTSSCSRVGRFIPWSRSTTEFACFPVEACHQWYSPLNSNNNRLTWPACQWKKGPDLAKDKWIPVSVCCPKPSFSREENPVRTLAKSLYELPIKKAHVTLSNKRQEDEFGHCGKVQLKTTPAARTIDKKSHLISLEKGTNSIYSVTSSSSSSSPKVPFVPLYPPHAATKMAPVAWANVFNKSPVNFTNHTNNRYKRIVGGFTTSIEYHPWMASLFIRGRYECGGVIVHARVVVTTAHCFKGDFDPSRLEVVVGSHHLATGQVQQVAQIIPHPEYRQDSVYDDIALVVLQHLLPFGPSVFPVCLRKFGTNELKEGLMATLIGYGSYYYGEERVKAVGVTLFPSHVLLPLTGGPMPDLLQEASVEIRSSDQCSRMYSKLSAKFFSKGIPSSLICAGTTGRGTDACQVGDKITRVDLATQVTSN